MMKITSSRVDPVTNRDMVRKKRLENSILIGIPLLGSLIAPFWVYTHGLSGADTVIFLVGYIAVGVGVSLGLHRFFSHRSFRASPLVAYTLGALGSMAFQGSIARWVADHRRHHAHTDQCGDLHSPRVDGTCAPVQGVRGFLHAHVGWMFDRSVTDTKIYGAGLMEDEVVAFFSRTHWLWPALSLFLPAAVGWIAGGAERATSALLIGGCLRTTVLHHTVWAVNSVGHSVGPRSYDTPDGSRNNLILAILTLGDGWHNNHHRYPRSAFHGLRPYEIDINGAIIIALEKIGVVWDVVRVDKRNPTS